jgi:hypothetical protein
MRTFLVMVRPSNFGGFADREEVQVKASSKSEAILLVVKKTVYLAMGCRLKKETKHDKENDNQRIQCLNLLKRAKLNRARLYQRNKKNPTIGGLKTYENLKTIIRSLNQTIRKNNW